MKIVKLNINLLLITFALISEMFAQNFKAEINSFIPPVNRFVNIGPCLINDSVFYHFEFVNKGNRALFMERLAPSFYLGAGPNDPSASQFNLYREIPLLPLSLLPDKRDTLLLAFRAGDTIVTKPGWHEALLALSFFDDATKEAPPVTKIDTFLLIVKKTTKHFDNFEDVINFDSVYINPTSPKAIQWRGKNTFYKDIILKNRNIKYITQSQTQNEFYFGESFDNLPVIPDGIINRMFSYIPNDLGYDSVRIRNIFVPQVEMNKDSTDSSSVLITGIGVQQKLSILESNIDFRNDTLFIGNLNANEKRELRIKFQNKGNIPIFAKNEKIINLISNQETIDFTFISKLQKDDSYLPKDNTSELILEFSSDSRGLINYQYLIETNLDERNIYGYPQSAININFYIQANIVSPKMIVQSDTLDFGNIALNNAQCPARRDTSIKFTNTGNSNLQIYDISLVPEYPQSPFRLISFNDFLNPASNGNIYIAFEEISDQVMDYESILTIKTNESQPANIRTIVLKANTLPPLSGVLSISDNIRAKPGRVIEVPIILNYSGKNPLSFAEKFETSLIYNRSILEFIGTTTLNTATEGSINKSDVKEGDNPEIKLEFESAQGNYLGNRDTIVKVRFNTFLGDAVSTEIALLNSKFGDSRCNNLFNLQISNGIFTADSICGIEYKAVQKPKSKLAINYFYENDDKVFEYSIPFSDNIELSIYDNYGNKIQQIFNQMLPSGVYQIKINETELTSGAYYIIIRNKYSYDSKQFIVIK